jgi:hypothetical protein
LSMSADSVWLRHGAHHVLRAMAARQGLPAPAQEVLAALEDVEPQLEVPPVAYRAHERLKHAGHRW